MDRKGFTLIELIIVISIIGILTSFVIARMGESEELSRDMRIEADIKIIKDGLTSYKVNNFNNFPILDCVIGQGSCAESLFLYLSPYLNFIPLPDNGVLYTYYSDGTDCLINAVPSDDISATPFYQYRCSQAE